MLMAMGKLVPFPGRFRNRRAATANVFGAFDELEAFERGPLKLVAASVLAALLVSLVLQLVSS
jgi:hypothetical protein